VTDNTVAGNATGISTANIRIGGITSNSATITTGGLTYSSGTLSVDGGDQRLNMSGTDAGSTSFGLTLATSRAPSTGSFYFSFMHRFNGALAGGDYGYTTFQPTASGYPSTINMATGSLSSLFRSAVGGTVSSSPSAFTANTVNFVVVEYLSDGANWTGANIWVNPSSAVQGAATYSISGATYNGTLVALAPLINGLDDGDSVDFDRMQLATTWAEAIPEPCTWLLITGAGIFFVIRRRFLRTA